MPAIFEADRSADIKSVSDKHTRLTDVASLVSIFLQKTLS